VDTGAHDVARRQEMLVAFRSFLVRRMMFVFFFVAVLCALLVFFYCRLQNSFEVYWTYMIMGLIVRNPLLKVEDASKNYVFPKMSVTIVSLVVSISAA